MVVLSYGNQSIGKFNINNEKIGKSGNSTDLQGVEMSRRLRAIDCYSQPRSDHAVGTKTIGDVLSPGILTLRNRESRLFHGWSFNEDKFRDLQERPINSRT